MKQLLLFIIRLYWIVPKKWRRSCLFTRTCSHYIFDVTRSRGCKAGWQALKKRIKQCRPVYGIYQTDDGTTWVILADNTVINKMETNL